MANKRARTTNRKSKGSFLAIPHELLLSDAYKSLSTKAVKCLIDVSGQYKGSNNGDLSCTFSVMQKTGWKSKNHLDNAKNELLQKGFIVLTRQGGRNKCNLYAITWQPIDECKGKLDRKATTTALGYWKKCANPEIASKKLISVPQIKGNTTPNREPVRQFSEYAITHCPK